MACASPSGIVYNGCAQKPGIVVTDVETGSTLAAGTDYSLAYSNNVNAGTGEATVTGIGDYAGETASCQFEIGRAPLTVVTASAAKPYDGKALTAPGRLKGLVNDETVTFKTTGSRKKMGQSKNKYKIAWNGTALKSNYEVIAERLGTLTVGAPTPGVIPGPSSSPGTATLTVPTPVKMPHFMDLSSLARALPDVPDVTPVDYEPLANADEEIGSGGPANTTSVFLAKSSEDARPLFVVTIALVAAAAALLVLFGLARRRRNSGENANSTK